MTHRTAESAGLLVVVIIATLGHRNKGTEQSWEAEFGLHYFSFECGIVSTRDFGRDNDFEVKQ